MTRLDTGETKIISLDKLYIWTDNPRIPTVYEEREAITLIYSVIGAHRMINLMKDIVNVGLQINESIIVVEKSGLYYVYDGNRRVSAIKTLMFPELIDDENTRKKVEDFKETLQDFSISDVEVKVVPEEVALELILRKHGNNSDGTSLISWSTWQRDKTLAKLNKTPEYSNAYKAIIDLGYRSASSFKDKYDIQYTDLERILSPEPVKHFFSDEISTKSSVEKRQYLEKFLQKISLIKIDENKPISRIFNKSENVEVALNTFKAEIALYTGDIEAFIPSPSLTPILGAITGNIISLVKQGQTIKNSVNTDDLLVFDFQHKGIDIDIYSNTVFLEIQRVHKSDLDKFPISFGALIRILLETTLTDYIKKIGKNSTTLAGNIQIVLESLDDSDFEGMEKLNLKSLKNFIKANMLDLTDPKKAIAGPYINNLQNLVHNGVGHVKDFRHDLNNYVIPFIIAMSNHLKNMKAKTSS